MANTFLTPDIVGREALMLLENNLVAANLFHRDHTKEFTGAKVGDTITVRGPATFTAQEFSTTTTTQDATESSVALQLEKHFDVTFEVTAKDWTLELEDFSEQLVNPAMAAIAQGIDAYTMGKYDEVYYQIGAAADPPDSLADVALIDRTLNENKVPLANRFCIVNPEAKADLFSISSFAQAEQRGDDGTALREASMGRYMGLDFYMSQNVKTHEQGTLTNGTAMKAKVNNGSVAIGDTSCPMDEASLTGTIKVGDVFTVAGDTQQYVVTADATAAGNALATVAFTPAAKVAWADDAVVTFDIDGVAEDDYEVNLAGHRNGLTLAVVPLELPRGAAKAEYVSDRGLGVRVVFGYDMSTKVDTISFDVLCGAKAQDPELLCRIAG